ncbi:MAG: aspartoacylase [Gemmatimonadetes bacterium]|nr:aspartoacylase [Gemmatimonadota bacterium]
MVEEAGTLVGPLPGLQRMLGRVRGSQPGPTVIGVGGLHGNEPAGVLALVRVLEELGWRGGELSGEFVGLAGNLAALAAGRRYLGRDLNRSWTPGGLAAAKDAGPAGSSEDKEQVELHSVIEEVMADARGPVFLLDLHTTSGPGEPFSTVLDSLRSRKFALGIPVPLIVGLGELVEGTLLGYLANRGVAGIVFEGGKHDNPSSVDASEAGIWLALAQAGLLDEGTFPEVTVSRDRLSAETKDLPKALELRYRHPISEAEGFKMLSGLRSFQRVGEGEILARNKDGPVRAPSGGRLLMPLYQTQGEDGFFLIREFHPSWLRVSEYLRRARVDRIIHWLPGIRRDSEGDGMVVNRRMARWFTLEILHLLGYRKEVDYGDRLVVLKQVE